MNLFTTKYRQRTGSVSTVLIRTILTLLILGALSQVIEACPTCKDGMAQDPARMNLVRGYFWSILFMMSMPFLIFSCLGLYFYREMRRFKVTNAARTSLSAPSLAESPSFSR